MAWLDEDELRKFKSVGRNVLVSREALIYGPENITIGDNTRIDAHTIMLASSGYINIGSHVHVAVQTLLSGSGGIDIEEFVAISMGAKIISASDDASGDYLVGPTHKSEYVNVKRERIVLDRYSWLGTNSVMLPGSSLGRGAMVGVNSFVKPGQKLQAWTIYAGNPVQKIKARSGRMIELAEKQKEWWLWLNGSN